MLRVQSIIARAVCPPWGMLQYFLINYFLCDKVKATKTKDLIYKISSGRRAKLH